MKKLVAFYSRADENFFAGTYKYVQIGNTEIAARKIAEAVGADLLHIEQEVPYAKDYKTCVQQVVRDFKEKSRPKVKNLPDNLNEYDEIYLGYPNYCGTMPMAVYTFLEAFDFTGKTIHPFITHEGSGIRNTPSEIASEAPGAIVTDGLSILGHEVEQETDKIIQWAKK